MLETRNIEDYKSIIGEEKINEIMSKVEVLEGKHILCINSTFNGGGVAEILNSLVPMFNKAGLRVGWRVLHGSDDFFGVTKGFHNALQGSKLSLSERKKRMYYENNRRFSTYTHIDHDLVVVHDPQPLAMIDFYEKRQPWIWRMHIDLSNPNPVVWNYLKRFVNKYDEMVVSHKNYLRDDVEVKQSIIPPAIDPLSLKNKELRRVTIEKYLSKYGVVDNKPIISQISRFDKWKDPVGVIRVFEKVRAKEDSQLILLGSMASDDPEGQKIFEKVEKAKEKSKYGRDIHLIMVHSDILVNVLQRASSVVIQKSIKEGFGLTVSEALYKGTPVVASNVGGIPLQVVNGVNGFLHSPRDYKGFSESILKLIRDGKLRKEFGKNGRDHVRNNFLITRLMDDWLNVFLKYLG